MNIEMILDEIVKLSNKLDNIKTRPEKPSRSEDLKELFTALAKAQSEMQIASLNQENPYFKSKYADLTDIVKASRPALSKNGLSVMQQVLPNEEGQNILQTILCHSSGQWIESRMRILPSKPDIQSISSYITYIRRITYAALVGVVCADEDDDAEVAVAQDRDLVAKGPSIKYDGTKKTYETISKDELAELEYELVECPDIAEMILNSMKIQNLADLPKNKYRVSITRVREIKNARNNGTN